MSDDQSQHAYAAHHAQTHTPLPPASPLGGYRRAVPRCALTGEPISADTVHRPVRRQHDDRPEPLHQHGRAHGYSYDGHDGHVRYHTPRVHQRELLPSLDELLDDSLDDAESVDEGQADDGE